MFSFYLARLFLKDSAMPRKHFFNFIRQDPVFPRELLNNCIQPYYIINNEHFSSHSFIFLISGEEFLRKSGDILYWFCQEGKEKILFSPSLLNPITDLQLTTILSPMTNSKANPFDKLRINSIIIRYTTPRRAIARNLIDWMGRYDQYLFPEYIEAQDFQSLLPKHLSKLSPDPHPRPKLYSYGRW